MQYHHLQLLPRKVPTESLAGRAPAWLLPAQHSSLWETSLRAVQLPTALQLLMMQPGRLLQQRKQQLPPAARQPSPQKELTFKVQGMRGQQELHLPLVLQSSLSVPVRSHSRSRCPGSTAVEPSTSPIGAA